MIFTAAACSSDVSDISRYPSLTVQSYVVIEEGSKKWVGYIDHQDEEFGDYHIRFLHPAGIRTSYYFPNSEKEHCFKSNEDIIGALPTPNLKGGTRIQYSFPNTCLRTLMNSS